MDVNGLLEEAEPGVSATQSRDYLLNPNGEGKLPRAAHL